MTFAFEELDSQNTPLGPISLRRRAEPRLKGAIVYEVKLGDEFLMSSLFTEAEIQLTKLGLKAVKSNGYIDNLDVVVGGLGLGYTALAALQDEAVGGLHVIELLPAVISWHQRGILPVGDLLATDNRCRLVHDDFFRLATAESIGFDSEHPQKKAHAVLLDIDHSPDFWLDPNNSRFYTPESLYLLREKLLPGGIFGLWSDELPDDSFLETLGNVFASVEAHVIRFPNPFSGEDSTNSVYLAHTPK